VNAEVGAHPPPLPTSRHHPTHGPRVTTPPTVATRIPSFIARAITPVYASNTPAESSCCWRTCCDMSLQSHTDTSLSSKASPWLTLCLLLLSRCYTGAPQQQSPPPMGRLIHFVSRGDGGSGGGGAAVAPADGAAVRAQKRPKLAKVSEPASVVFLCHLFCFV
jgi:hypothetical protein